jgi:hypothetical protein
VCVSRDFIQSYYCYLVRSKTLETPHYAIFCSVLYVLHLRYRRTLNILFSNPLTLCSSLSVRYGISLAYRTKILVLILYVKMVYKYFLF